MRATHASRRLAAIVEALNLIQQHQFARSVDAVREMAKTVREPQFDFESASNLVALMAQLSAKAIQLNELGRTPLMSSAGAFAATAH